MNTGSRFNINFLGSSQPTIILGNNLTVNIEGGNYQIQDSSARNINVTGQNTNSFTPNTTGSRLNTNIIDRQAVPASNREQALQYLSQIADSSSSATATNNFVANDETTSNYAIASRQDNNQPTRLNNNHINTTNNLRSREFRNIINDSTDNENTNSFVPNTTGSNTTGSRFNANIIERQAVPASNREQALQYLSQIANSSSSATATNNFVANYETTSNSAIASRRDNNQPTRSNNNHRNTPTNFRSREPINSINDATDDEDENPAIRAQRRLELELLSSREARRSVGIARGRNTRGRLHSASIGNNTGIGPQRRVNSREQRRNNAIIPSYQQLSPLPENISYDGSCNNCLVSLLPLEKGDTVYCDKQLYSYQSLVKVYTIGNKKIPHNRKPINWSAIYKLPEYGN